MQLYHRYAQGTQQPRHVLQNSGLATKLHKKAAINRLILESRWFVVVGTPPHGIDQSAGTFETEVANQPSHRIESIAGK